jgi:hypothetical protein
MQHILPFNGRMPVDRIEDFQAFVASRVARSVPTIVVPVKPPASTDHPGCWGAAARLPKNPGSQKLTPPSSAVATVGTAITALSNADAKAPINAPRAIVGCFISAP